MALRDIVKDIDPSLRKVSRTVTAFDGKLHKLLDDMLETMNAHDGVGIAAPQVGILRRAALIITVDNEIVEFINPVFTKTGGGVQFNEEGCLSVEGRRGIVKRPMNVTVKAQDRNGKFFTREFTGMNAVECCHEFDHLDGILFYDKLAKPEEIPPEMKPSEKEEDEE